VCFSLIVYTANAVLLYTLVLSEPVLWKPPPQDDTLAAPLVSTFSTIRCSRGTDPGGVVAFGRDDPLTRRTLKQIRYRMIVDNSG